MDTRWEGRSEGPWKRGRMRGIMSGGYSCKHPDCWQLHSHLTLVIAKGSDALLLLYQMY